MFKHETDPKTLNKTSNLSKGLCFSLIMKYLYIVMIPLFDNCIDYQYQTYFMTLLFTTN